MILAKRWPTGRWQPYEAIDRTPWAEEAAGAHVVVAGHGWRPTDLVEDLMVRNEITEAAAHDLAAGHPWHRPHHCVQQPTQQPEQDRQEGTTHP